MTSKPIEFVAEQNETMLGINTPRHATTVSEFGKGSQRFVLNCYDTLDGIAALEADWKMLETISNEGFDYFQTFDWCYGWCTKFIDEKCKLTSDKPQIYVLSHNTRPVMIWPMIETRSRSGLYFLETITEPLGQYANVLFDAKYVDIEIGARTWAEIKAHTKVDAISLNHFPQTGLLADIIGKEGMDETVKYVSSVLDYEIITTWDDYSNSLSKSQRKERKRKLRKLSSAGELTFDVHFHDSNNFFDLVKTAVEMKRNWLSETDRHSQSLFKEESLQFLCSLGQYLPKGDFREGPVVHVLNLDGNPIAVELGMLKNRHYYSYLGAIDLNWSEYSPGKVQIEMSQKWAFENGVKKFDFLSDPSDYKQSWSNRTVQMETRYVPISAQGYFYCSIWKAQLRPLLRSMYQRSSPGIRRKINMMLGLN